MFSTHVLHIKVLVGIEHNGKNGEDCLQDSKLEGTEFEQEKGASGGRTEETI